MAAVITIKSGLAASWTSKNPVLALGEWGMETDTLKFKLGNGTLAWNALPYFGAVTAAIAAAAAAAETAAKAYADSLAVNGVHYKGEVADMTALNAVTTKAVGDEYLVNDDGNGHTVFAIWDGTEWDFIEIDLGDYYTKTELDTLLGEKEDAANKGVPGGYAGLDENGKLDADAFPDVIDGGNIDD